MDWKSIPVIVDDDGPAASFRHRDTFEIALVDRRLPTTVATTESQPSAPGEEELFDMIG